MRKAAGMISWRRLGRLAASAMEAGHKLAAVLQLCRRGQSILAFIDGLSWALHALPQDAEWALERWAQAEHHRTA